MTARSRIARLYARSRQPRWAVAGQAVTSGANFLTTLIIVRSLGLEEFGRFSVCFLLLMIVRGFLAGLVLTPMSTIAPKLSLCARAPYRGFLAVNGLAFALGASLALYLLATPLGVLLNAPWLPGLALTTALANLAANGADFVHRHHIVEDAPVRAFAVDGARYCVQLGVLLALSIVWREAFRAETALLALAVGGLAGLIAGSIRYGEIGWSGRLSRAVWPRHWNFVRWMAPGVLLEALQSSGLFLIGGALLGPSALGVLRTMESLANAIALPANALQQIAPSLAAGAYRARGMRGLKALLGRMTLSLLAVFAAMALALSVCADAILVHLYDSSIGDHTILYLFLFVHLLVLVRFPLTMTAQTLELPRIVFLAAVMSLLSGLAVLFATYGPAGAPAVPLARIAVQAGGIAALAALLRAAGRHG